MSVTKRLERPAVRVGDIEFTYSQPHVAVDSANRTKKHKLLSEVAVVQKLGTEPLNLEISGMCTTEEAKAVDNLVVNDKVEVRSHRKSCAAVVQDSSTSPRNEIRMGKHLHDFTINVTEIA